MAVNTSGYTTTAPASGDLISAGDDEIRSSKSYIRAVLDDEHYFTTASASSLSGGVHKRGSARIFSGARASLTTPSSADSHGRLYYAEDTGGLHFIATSSMSTILSPHKPVSCVATATGALLGAGLDWVGVAVGDTTGVGGHPAAWFGTGGSSVGTVPSGVSGRFHLSFHMTAWRTLSASPAGPWGVGLEVPGGGGLWTDTTWPSSATTFGVTVSGAADLSSGDTIGLWYTGSQGTIVVLRFSATRAL